MSERRLALRVRTPSALALAACLLAGCERTSSSKNSGGRIDSDPAAFARGEIQLVVIDLDGYDEVIAARRGQVVLVDFWATWCGPCVAQLPHTIELADRFGKRGLAVVTVSCDDPSESERVAEFLRSQGAGGVTNLISRYGASPQSMEAFEIASGAVPHYKLFDRAGNLRRTFGVDPVAKRQFTVEEIDAAIEQLLAE